MIASYEVVLGGCSVIYLLTGRSHEAAGESEVSKIVDRVLTFVHSLALLAGLKGLVGILHRDPRRLRMLLFYHVGELAVRSVSLIFREVEACRVASSQERPVDLKRPQEPHHHKVPTIETILVEYCIHVVLFGYFIYAIWSLITRLEAGEFGRSELFDNELADRTGLGESGLPPSWFFLGAAGSDTNAGLLSQQRTPLNAGGGGPQPFSGQPRTLNDPLQDQGIEHFRGTPHRLDE